MFWLQTLLLAALLPVTIAVFADEAYKVDFHYELLGLPRDTATCFHQPHPGSKASLLYTLSDKAVVGAVNPKDGRLVWRQWLDTSGPASKTFLRPGVEQEVILGARDGILTAWNAADGRIVWERTFRAASIRDVQWRQGAHEDESAGSTDILVLVENAAATEVRRLDGRTGRTVSKVLLESQKPSRCVQRKPVSRIGSADKGL